MTTEAIDVPMTINVPYDRSRIYEIPLDDIEADSGWNCRGYIDPTDVLELSRDIQQHGLDQPVTVMPHPTPKGKKRFKLVAGYRRFKAHQMIGFETIKAIIRDDLDETKARILNLTENLHRKDLNIKQEAHAIKQLRFVKPALIAQRLDKSPGWVNVRLSLLQLPELLQDEAAAGRITSDEIRKCAELGDEETMFEYVKAVKDARLKGLKKEVEPEKIKPSNESRLRSKTEIQELQGVIREVFGNGIATKVLAWAGGYLTPLEMHTAIKEAAALEGRYYAIPDLGL